MSRACTLRIKTPTFTLHLEGDADLVRSGYEGAREELLKRLAAMTASSGPAERPSPSPRRPREVGAEAGPEYLWVFRCNDLYHKVHVVERSQLYQTGLGRHLQPERLSRVYVESDHAPLLEPLVPRGKTLWSELTGLGRQRLRQS